MILVKAFVYYVVFAAGLCLGWAVGLEWETRRWASKGISDIEKFLVDC